MKNKLKKMVFSLALLGSTLSVADMSSYEPDTKSLVGIEGGYSRLDYNKDTQAITSVRLVNAGLKLGAETQDFRAFISGRYFYDSSAKYEYLTTFGGELQYKFNVSKVFDLFLGVNGGYAFLRFDTGDGFGPRSVASPYFGGDIGGNVHLGKKLDLELGGRVMSIQATHNSVAYGDYNIGNIVNAYASLIFKWQMN